MTVTSMSTQIAGIVAASDIEIFDSVPTFFRSFICAPGKIVSIVGQMVLSPDMMKRRMGEGAEFFRFVHESRATAQ
jgi:hypothetical protein